MVVGYDHLTEHETASLCRERNIIALGTEYGHFDVLYAKRELRDRDDNLFIKLSLTATVIVLLISLIR